MVAAAPINPIALPPTALVLDLPTFRLVLDQSAMGPRLTTRTCSEVTSRQSMHVPNEDSCRVKISQVGNNPDATVARKALLQWSCRDCERSADMFTAEIR